MYPRPARFTPPRAAPGARRLPVLHGIRARLAGGVAAGLVAVAAAALAPSCTNRVAHVFGGYGYEASNFCLDLTGGIDVIDGPDPGTCSQLRCWVSPAHDVFVTDTACDAPPDYHDGTADPAGTPCGKALALYAVAGHSLCPDGGGALPPPDGGPGDAAPADGAAADGGRPDGAAPDGGH